MIFAIRKPINGCLVSQIKKERVILQHVEFSNEHKICAEVAWVEQSWGDLNFSFLFLKFSLGVEVFINIEEFV